jgi:hypothetical protein
MRMGSFHRYEDMCLCLIISALSHSNYDRQHISFPLIYYVDGLV